MRYFTSDLHLGHDREFIYRDRGFNSMTEHDIVILNRINETVKEDDELYILGDFVLGTDLDYVRRCVEEIVCQNIHLILGNHDTPRKIEIYKEFDKIVEICYATMINYNKKITFYCSHFPTIMDSDDPEHLHYIGLYGHTHQKISYYCGDNNALSKLNPRMFNVGIDAHGRPISERSIVENVQNMEEFLRRLKEKAK